MRFLILLLIVYAAAVVQTSLSAVWQVGHVAPDLLALVAVVWLLRAAGPESFLVAGGVGLAADLIGPGSLGVSLASFLLVGYAVARLRRKSAPQRLPWQVMAVCAAVTVLAACRAMGHWLLGEVSLSPPAILSRAAGVGLYTAGVSLPLWMIIGWIREPHLARKRRLADF